MATARPYLPSLPAADAARDGTAFPPRTTRDRVVDLLFLLVAMAAGLGGYFSEFPQGPATSVLGAVDLAGGLFAWTALWWRRRWPVQLALACVPVGAVSNAGGIATLLLLFTLAVHRPWKVVAAVTSCHVAATFVWAALYPDDDLPYAFLVLFVVVVLGAVVAWGMFIRARRELVLSLRERAVRAEADQQLHAERARSAERARIAREMHDVLAHRISLLSMHAGALEFRPDASPAEVAAAAGVIRAAAHDALEDLREVIGVLRSDAGAGSEAEADGRPARPQPTLGDLPALLEESRAAGMRVREELTLDCDAHPVPAGLGRTVYRIVQEGLTNARKHAGGAGVFVRLSGTPLTGITAEVTNRAPVGTALSGELPGTGTGIVGLSERTALAGGRLHHGPTAEGGFRLRAWLPWPVDAPGRGRA